MKKTLLLLPFVLLSSVSCRSKISDSSISDKESFTDDSTTNNETDNRSDSDRDYSRLTINYSYQDGTFLYRETKSLLSNEAYSIPVVLNIPFMSPNMSSIEGIKGNKEEFVDVVYSYSNDEINEPTISTHYSSFMANEDYGISFSFYAKSLSSNQTLFKGKHFEITSSSISDGENVIYYSSSYMENPYDSSLRLQQDEQAIYTFSFFSDKAVIYKNTHRVFTIFNNRTTGNSLPKYNTIYKSILSDIREDGFTLGQKSIYDLTVSGGIEQKDVIKRKEKYIITELQCIDENNDIIEMHSKVGKEPYSYSFSITDLPNYRLEDSAVLSGYARESKTIKATQIFSGANHSLSVNQIDSSNETGWSEESKWLKYAENLMGDFTMKVSLLNYGAISYDAKPSKGGEVCWRTVLPIVYDTKSKDRWVTRFDWYGWMDDVNNDGKTLGTSANYNNGDCYLFDYDTDIYPVYKEMEIDITYSRRGQTLYLDSIIKPKRTPYLRQQYSYHCTLYGVQSDSLSFALSAEDSIGIITSLQY